MLFLGYYVAYTLCKTALFIYVVSRYIDTLSRRLLDVGRVPDRVPVSPLLLAFCTMAIPVLGWCCIYVGYRIGTMEEEAWEKWRDKKGI